MKTARAVIEKCMGADDPDNYDTMVGGLLVQELMVQYARMVIKEAAVLSSEGIVGKSLIQILEKQLK